MLLIEIVIIIVIIIIMLLCNMGWGVREVNGVKETMGLVGGGCWCLAYGGGSVHMSSVLLPPIPSAQSSRFPVLV